MGPSWREAGKIYRRVCFLRSQGRDAEAQWVQDTDLVRALAAARAEAPAGPETEAAWQAMQAAEEERVAEAVALSELLAPMLKDRLALPLAASAALPPPRPAAAIPRAQAPSVADFIEEMLAQERVAKASP